MKVWCQTNYPKNIAKYERKSYTVSTVIQQLHTGLTPSLAEHTRDIRPHSMCYPKDVGAQQYVFIYSKVRSCHTCCQMRSDYRDSPKDIVTAMRFLLSKSQTHLEWAVESSDFGYLILYHFTSIRVDFWLMCGGDSVFFKGYQFALLWNADSFQRESQVITLRWLVSLLRRFKREPWEQYKTHHN